MIEKQDSWEHTALIIPDGRTRIFDRVNIEKSQKIPSKDIFIGKVCVLARMYAEKYYTNHWYQLGTNVEEDRQLTHPETKIFGRYDLPPYRIPGYDKHWNPIENEEYLDAIKKNARDLDFDKYEKIIFLGNWTPDPSWVENAHKKQEYEYTAYVNAIKAAFPDKWLEFPLIDAKSRQEIISRISDSINRGFPLRRCPYKLKNIRIDNLFLTNTQEFDYNIPLSPEENLSIITSPNGFGKSTIFRILHATFSNNIKQLVNEPFQRLEISIIDENRTGKNEVDTLIVEKIFGPEDSGCESEPNTQKIEIDYIRGNTRKEKSKFTLTMDQVREDRKNGLGKYIPPFVIRYIPSDRLCPDFRYEYDFEKYSEKKVPTSSKMESMRVLHFSESLKMRILGTLANYASVSHEIDMASPKTYVEKKTSTRQEIFTLENLNDLNEKRMHLEKMGFLPSYRRWLKDEIFEHGDDLKKVIEDPYLQIFYKNQIKKYLVFDWLLTRCQNFTHIINNLFLNAKISIDGEDGFTFFFRKSNCKIKGDKLSSGEQHQVVMYYDFLFNCDPGTLVLIDEPEISLHIVWQEQFTKNLQDIINLNHLNFLIATHSPYIINDNLKNTYHLGGKENV